MRSPSRGKRGPDSSRERFLWIGQLRLCLGKGRRNGGVDIPDYHHSGNRRRCFKKEGFKFAKLLEVPGMGHSAPPAEWFDKGLEFLDKPK